MEIYRQLVLELKEAIALIDNPSANAITVDPSTDPTFGGDLNNWKRFANTLILKLLIRESESSSSESASYVAAEMAALSGAEFISNDVKINPGYTQDTNRQNPLYGYFFRVDGTRELRA